MQVKSAEEKKEVMSDPVSLREGNSAEVTSHSSGEERKRDQGDDPVKPDL